MKFVKGIAFTVIGLFGLVTLISLLMPSRVVMVRHQSISAPVDSVYPYISDLSRWANWHPLFQSPDLKIQLENTGQGKLSVARWNMNQKENVLSITSDSAHVCQASLSRIDEKPVRYIISVMPGAGPSVSEVEWKVVMDLKWYPWEKFSGIFAEQATGPGYETALRNLKALCENK